MTVTYMQLKDVYNTRSRQGIPGLITWTKEAMQGIEQDGYW